MITPVFICALVVIISIPQCSASPPMVPGAVLEVSRGARFVTPGSECPTTDTGFLSCTADCRGQNYCMNGNVVATHLCPNTGYCNYTTNACQDKPVECVTANTTCTIGFLPDLKNCSRFTYCDGQYIYRYLCIDPKGVFNATNTFCQIGPTCNVYTNTSGCAQNNGKFIPYKGSSSYYVLCANNSLNLQIVLQCKPNYIFNMTAQGCYYNCSGEGFYEDVEDNTSYYFCYRRSATSALIWRNYKCPETTTFDTVARICHYPSAMPLLDALEDDTPEEPKICSNSSFADKCNFLGHISLTDYESSGLPYKGFRVMCYQSENDQAVVLYDCPGIFVDNKILHCKVSYLMNQLVPSCTINTCNQDESYVIFNC